MTFVGSFAFTWGLHITYVYKAIMTIKANQNKIVKPTTSSLYVVQSMNKIEGHGYTWLLYRALCL